MSLRIAAARLSFCLDTKRNKKIKAKATLPRYRPDSQARNPLPGPTLLFRQIAYIFSCFKNLSPLIYHLKNNKLAKFLKFRKFLGRLTAIPKWI